MARNAPPVRLLVCGAIGVLLWVGLLTGWMIWDARRVDWEHAAKSRDNIAAVIEHDVERTIEVYDLSLQSVVNGLRVPGVDSLSPELRRLVLFDQAATAEHFGSIRVLDESGRVVVASRPEAVGEDFADSEFFRELREQGTTGVAISAPFQTGADGKWSVAIGRRLRHPDGTFAGVVFGTLHLDFFANLFALIDSGPGGVISIYRADGRLLYRSPFDPSLLGRDFSHWPLFHNQPLERAGTLGVQSRIDGIKRAYSYRRLDPLPLVLTVGMTQSSVFAQWQQKAITIGIATLTLAIAVAALTAALIGALYHRSRAEQAALANERRYRFLTEHSFDMIVRFDPHSQQRTYISPACRRLYGYEPDEALSISAEEIIHPDDLDGVRQALARVVEGGEQQPILYRGRHKDGEYIWVEASLTRSQDPDTGVVEIVSIVRDANDRMRYETALRRGKEEADAANRSKSEFLATMSHELRTPLNAIIGFAEMMEQEILGPIDNQQYRSYVTDIHLSGTHLLQLINDILDLTKAEAGKLEVNEDIIDPGDAIRSVVRVSTAAIEKAQLKVEVGLPAELPRLRADERKTRQVLFNLIGNAVKFTPPRGRIMVSAGVDPDGTLRITVADSGIGIAPQDLNRVLEPFVQVDNTLSRQHDGTGLGLSAVKAMMELHGGRLELRSVIDSGTEASVVFPAERVVERSTAETQPAA